MALVISKKIRIVLFVVLGVLVLGGGGFLIWRVNQPDTVAPEDSEAADSSEKSGFCKDFSEGGVGCVWLDETELAANDYVSQEGFSITEVGCYYKTTNLSIYMYSQCTSFYNFVSGCGNGECNGEETKMNCPEDCDFTEGDNVCDEDLGENSTNSPGDCCECSYGNIGCFGSVNCGDIECDEGVMCQMLTCESNACLQYKLNDGGDRYKCGETSTTCSGSDDEDDDPTPYTPPSDDGNTDDEDDSFTWSDPYDDETEDTTTTWSDWFDWGQDTDNTSFFGLWDHDTDYNSFFDWGDDGEEGTWTSTTRYTLIYRSGIHGYIWGIPYQLVKAGENGSSVKAIPYWGYEFSKWSDGSTANPRTDTNVSSDLTVTAEFVRKTTTTYEPGDGYVDSTGDVVVVTETGGTQVVYSNATGTMPQTGIFDSVVGKLSLGIFFIFLGGIVSQYSKLNYFYNSIVQKSEFRKEIRKQKRAKRIRNRLEDKFK